MIHFIKRYANRKLYDTFIKKYITLDHIEEMIEKGENLEVIENGTNKDITAVVLSQVITNKAKKAKEYSSTFFAEILRRGSDLLKEHSDSLKKHSDSLKKHSDSMCDYTKKIVQNISKTNLSLEDILGITEENNAKLEERLQLLSQFIIEKFHLPTWKDIERLEQKIQELEKMIQEQQGKGIITE